MIVQPTILTDKADVPPGATLIESFDSSLKELFFIRNPHLKKPMPEAQEPLQAFLANHGIPEIWIYYPSRNVVLHTVAEKEYLELRTARNKNIILESEQIAYRNLSVGIAGLSVGSAVIRSIVLTGGPQRIKIADFDTLEISNLNRLNASIFDLGKNKTQIAADYVWSLDPFADLVLFEQGMTVENMSDFLSGNPKLDIFIDEMDSIDLKIKSRLMARELHIPVVMATDNGDGIILDVERFDEESERPIFHGLIDDLDPEHLGAIDYKTWLKLATRIVGFEYLPPRMQESIVSIGKVIAGVPQLGTSAEIAGAAISLVLRRIASKLSMPSGRYMISLEEKLIPGYMDPEAQEARRVATEQFKHGMQS